MPPETQFLRRREAGEYLKSRYGFCSPKSLGKLATVGGGPEYHKAGPAVVYAVPKLDEWALARLSGPCQSRPQKVMQRRPFPRPQKVMHLLYSWREMPETASLAANPLGRRTAPTA
jgi:hypothetical protein